MQIAIVPIGNSKGIRIPKTILEQCHIKRKVNLEAKGDRIVITPCEKTPRKGWDQAFKKMAENKDDRLVIDDQIDLDIRGWEW